MRALRASATPRSTLAAFGSGLVAGGTFLVIELGARVAAGVPTLPELVQDRLVQALPGAAFSFLLDRLLYLGNRCSSPGCSCRRWSSRGWWAWRLPAGPGPWWS